VGRPSEFQIINGAALSDSHELFCTLVASGVSYAEATETAGFAKGSGSFLMRQPAVRQRVEKLIGEPDKARLAAKYWLAVIRTEEVTAEIEAGTEEWRANMALHLNALDKLARLHGWIVDRKQVSQVTARLSVPRGDLEAAIRADIERLAPGAMKQLEAGVSGEEQLRAIAAGVDVQPSGKDPTNAIRAR
jgi:hypothetical protein